VIRRGSRAARAIAEVTGRVPVGFRAPGYTVTDEIFDVLESLDVRFDSSVFPCPAYGKAVVLACSTPRPALRARSSTRRACSARRRARTGPAGPTRRDRAGSRLPIQVTPGLRLPVIGTSIALAGPPSAHLAALRGSTARDLELHSIDFLAPDGLEALRSTAGARRTAERRLLALTAFVGPCAAGYSACASAGHSSSAAGL
jgi:hypothetical protein